MEYKLIISEDEDSQDGLAELIRNIAEMIDRGYTSGYYPTWTLEEG